jgi:regulator of sirC expression with transglutaminase-like and TPR domain
MRATLGESDQILLVVGTLAVLDEAWDEAIYWLDAAKRSTATPTPAILNNLAIAIVRARRMERCREALTLVDTAMTLLPDNADLFASRAEIYLALKDQSAALKDLQQAVKLQPDNAEALRLLRVLDAAEQR